MKIVKRILAWAGIIVIAVLYLATFVCGFFTGKSEMARMLFKAALASTVMVPVFLYVLLWLHGVLEKYAYKDKEQPEEKEEREDE